jgi:hypothetical protein
LSGSGLSPGSSGVTTPQGSASSVTNTNDVAKQLNDSLKLLQDLQEKLKAVKQ